MITLFDTLKTSLPNITNDFTSHLYGRFASAVCWNIFNTRSYFIANKPEHVIERIAHTKVHLSVYDLRACLSKIIDKNVQL